MKKHDLHIIMEKELKIYIKQINEFDKKTVSANVNMIIKETLRVIDFYQVKVDELNSNYENIAVNDEVLSDTHLYLDEDIYKKIKHIHHDLNVYSLAQIVRFILRKFIFLYKKYGFNKAMEKLSFISKSFQKKISINKLIMKKIRQLYKYKYYTVIYDRNFSPVCYKFLNL